MIRWINLCHYGGHNPPKRSVVEEKFIYLYYLFKMADIQDNNEIEDVHWPTLLALTQHFA
jgi:hypothetical protein